MRFLPLFLILTAGLLCGARAAQPMTAKDVALMVRMNVPEADIFVEVARRRLITAIDSVAERTLASSGATAAFIEKLKAGKYTLTGTEAAAAQRAAAETRAAIERRQGIDLAAFEARQRQGGGAAPTTLSSDKMLSLLDGKLVKLRGDQIVPFDARELKHTRIFAIYNSAHWCAPCRQFTPQLVEFYKRVKPAHPEFELIFLSSDRDEFNMANYMRIAGMPWPAVRFGAGDTIAKQYCGDGIPWLVVIDDAGRPLTQNGIDKKYIDAEKVLAATEARLNAK